MLVAAVLCCCPTHPAHAQGGPPGATFEAGQAVPSSTPLLSSAALQSPLLGGVPEGGAVAGVVRLSLHDAIQRGLQHNLGIVLGRERVRAADGTKWVSMSGLLPNVSARITQARQQINLEEYGFPVSPGGSPIIGPFSVSDRRVSVTQAIFDYSAIQHARAGSAVKAAAEYGFQDLREQVVVTIATLYFQTVATVSRIESARAQLTTADALHSRAVSMKQAGTVAGIEVLRAQVVVESQKQRLIYFENELAKSKLVLARAIGLPLAQVYELTDLVPFKPFEALAVDTAIEQALARRADYRSAQALLRSAEAGYRSACSELAPSVNLTANYGDAGPTWDSALTTFNVTANVRIPLFQGGRERGRILQARAALEQQRAQLADLKVRVEYDVRAAFLDLRAADERVRVARTAAELAGQQLTQAQDRFSAGVASHVEVVQAQEAVATASENLIGSLFAHNVAKASLARALGVAEDAAERMLGGQQ
jgi:outer membrane protein TolC